jgi:hypothetical protein
MSEVTIIDAMTDPALFGKHFGGDTWAAWRSLLGGFYGLPLDEVALDTFKAVTALEQAPTAPADELWLAVGRRGGKSHAAALIATFEAAFHDHRAKLAPGEVATVMLIAGDRQQARTLQRYVRGMFEHPMLRRMVLRETVTGLELSNRCVIEVGTASFRGVRGYTLAAVIADEIAFWMSDGASPDEEVIAALRPALATLGGKLIAISSPYARRGILWTTYRKHFGQANDRVLVAQAPSRTMNPNLSERVVDEAMKDDSARASAEYLAQFRTDVEAFLTMEIVCAAQRQEPLVVPPLPSVRYFAFVDPSGGGADEFTLAIGHKDGQRIVVDLVTGKRGNPASITAEFCALLKEYRCHTVRGDRYSGEWSRTEFARHGVTYLDAPGARTDLYLSLGSALNAGRVELPPCQTLERQLVALERRTSRGGRDQIDHSPGAHDDRANAAAGMVAVLVGDNRNLYPSFGSYGLE